MNKLKGLSICSGLHCLFFWGVVWLVWVSFVCGCFFCFFLLYHSMCSNKYFLLEHVAGILLSTVAIEIKQ